MTATIQKWGNSLALRIPKAVARQIQVREGDSVTLKVGSSGLSIKPAPGKIALDDLLKKVARTNLHSATDWGGDKGREVLPP